MVSAVRSDASLRGKIRAAAAKHGLRPQEVLQMYLFEHLLMRFAASAHIRVRYGRIDAPIKVDITTGDVITPRQVEYAYPLMFDGGTLSVMSYPLPTILAEKLETVVRRGIASTRGRDLYDIHMLTRLYLGLVDREQLREALAATAEKRGSAELLDEWEPILDEIAASPIQARVWSAYVDSAPYAADVALEEAVDSAKALARFAFEGDLR